MPTFNTDQMGQLLAPYVDESTNLLLDQLSLYLDLLLKWNERTNLTAIREPAEIVRRHFGESLFAAKYLPACQSLLDLGSGAGFPGIPIQLACPELAVVLAESQQKKASFLREVVRSLRLKTEVWSGRVEAMPLERRFDVVALRAVDDPALALQLARMKLESGGKIYHLTVRGECTISAEEINLPRSVDRVLRIMSADVPRGTSN